MAITFIKPIKDGYVTSPFGWRTHPVTGQKNSWHQGVDYAIKPNTNIPVLASADGEVIRTGALGTYGNVVMIKHNINGKHMETNYAHLKDGSIKVKVGQKVKQGDAIGIMGSTGSSTGNHVHFEIHDPSWVTGQKNAVNPELYIDKDDMKDKQLVLPSTVSSWDVYKTGKTLVKANVVGSLNPKKFGGLTYDIIDNPQENVYTIETKNFGKVNISAPKSTGVKIQDKKAEQPKTENKPQTTPQKTTPKKKYLKLPSTVSSWNVYPTNKEPIKANAIGSLNPKKFNGLTYEILGNPKTDVYTIKTSNFGTVNIYAAKSTGAVIQ